MWVLGFVAGILAMTLALDWAANRGIPHASEGWTVWSTLRLLTLLAIAAVAAGAPR